jgi:anti-anti-sigma factor
LALLSRFHHLRATRCASEGVAMFENGYMTRVNSPTSVALTSPATALGPGRRKGRAMTSYLQSVPSQAGDETLASIIVGYRDGVTILELVGEHDMTTADNITFHITEQVARGRGVVVSLTETEFIDSTILRVLFHGDRQLLRYGRRLVVHGADCDAVRRVVEVAGVNDHLLCSDTLDEAIEFASQRSA